MPGSFQDRVSFVAIAALVFIAMARIADTYSVFNQTWDEAVHIAAGLQWLEQGTYTYDPVHPPLARIAAAVGPFLDGIRSFGKENVWKEGNEVLHARGTYFRNLTLARLGILPFFIVATFLVWKFTKILFGNTAALLAVFFFTTAPPVLAHAGVATTDFALAALFVAALLALHVWLERPTFLRSLLLGLTMALALLSKLSAIVFLPAGAVPMIILHGLEQRRAGNPSRLGIRRWLVSASVSTLVLFLVVWAGYRFSVAPLHDVIDTDGIRHDSAYIAAQIKVPAPELFKGIQTVAMMSQYGHLSYLLGENRRTGWWYFFPVTLAVKTPLPLLILACTGSVITAFYAWRSGAWRALGPAVVALALLLVVLPSRINLGIRYILPMFPLLAIVAGFTATSLWKLRYKVPVGPLVVVVLLVWQTISSARAHPDYLAYFNELAERHPEKILVKDDLDWGQDLQRLVKVLRDLGVEEVAIRLSGSADLRRHGLPRWRLLLPEQRTSGWVAISLQWLKQGMWVPPYDQYAWLEAYEPVALVGRSIRLYYIPPDPDTSSSPP